MGLQASLRHVGQGASGAELQRCRGEVAVLCDRLARAQAQADASRRQLRDAEARLCLGSTTLQKPPAAAAAELPLWTMSACRLCCVLLASTSVSSCWLILLAGLPAGEVLRAGLQAVHAAKEQQAADRLSAVQRDIGDLQVDGPTLWCYTMQLRAMEMAI